MSLLGGVQLIACWSRTDLPVTDGRMRILLSVLLCLIFVHDYSGAARRSVPNATRLTFLSVRLDPGNPGRRNVGQLEYLEGVEIREHGPGIGGYSALSVAGDRFTLLSDGGNFLKFRWLGGERFSDPVVGALPKGPGQGWVKADWDSESMAVDPATRQIWVGYENRNEIWRYTPDFGRETGHVKSTSMNFIYNSGAESLVRRRDGSFIVLSEVDYKRCGIAPYERLHCGILFDTDPVEAPERYVRFGYKAPPDYLPVDAAELPDGRLLVLNRAFGPPFGFSSKLTLIDAEAIQEGAVVEGRTIATLDRPLIHDNFEGVAVGQENGRTIIWIVSDDNQLFLQRTLLLKFALVE